MHELDYSRIPPFDESAERSLLGSLTTDYIAMMESVRSHGIPAEAFYVPAHRLIFAALEKLDESDKAVNIITLIDAMRTNGDLDTIGGETAIHRLVDSSLGIHLNTGVLDVVRQKWLLREIVDCARETERKANEGYLAEDIASEAENAFSTLGVKREAETVKGVFADIKRDMILGMLGGRVEIALPTGFQHIDKLLGGGLRPGGVYYITGKKGCGKTTFKCNVANQQLFAGRTVSDASLEMTMRQEIEKMAGAMMNCNVSNVITGGKEAIPKTRIDEIEQIISGGRLRIETNIETTAQLRAWARREVERFGADIIMVDYIQLIRSADTKGAKIFEQITECSRAITRVAKEFNIPILCVSMMSDEGLWGSRQLDYDAYATLEMRTTSEPEAPDWIKDVECYFNKNRFGPEHFGLPMKLHGRVGRIEMAQSQWTEESNEYDA